MVHKLSQTGRFCHAKNLEYEFLILLTFALLFEAFPKDHFIQTEL